MDSSSEIALAISRLADTIVFHEIPTQQAGWQLTDAVMLMGVRSEPVLKAHPAKRSKARVNLPANR